MPVLVLVLVPVPVPVAGISGSVDSDSDGRWGSLVGGGVCIVGGERQIQLK